MAVACVREQPLLKATGSHDSFFSYRTSILAAIPNVSETDYNGGYALSCIVGFLQYLIITTLHISPEQF